MGGGASVPSTREQHITDIVRRAREAARGGAGRTGAITPNQPPVSPYERPPVSSSPYASPLRPPSSLPVRAPESVAEDESSRAGGGGGSGGGIFGRALGAAGSVLGAGLGSSVALIDRIDLDIPETVWEGARDAYDGVRAAYAYAEYNGVEPLAGRFIRLTEALGGRPGQLSFQKPSLSKLKDVLYWEPEEARAYFRQNPEGTQFLSEMAVLGGPGKARDLVAMGTSLVKAPYNIARFPAAVRSARIFRTQMIDQALVRADREAITPFEALRRNAKDLGLVNDGLFMPRLATLDELDRVGYKPDVWMKGGQAAGRVPLLRSLVIGANPTAVRLDRLTRVIVNYNRALENAEVAKTIGMGQLALYGRPIEVKDMIVQNVTVNEEAVTAAIRGGKLTSTAAALVRERTLREVLERPQYFELGKDQLEWLHTARLLIDQAKDEAIRSGVPIHELLFDVAAGEHYLPSVVASRHGIERIAGLVKGKSVGGAISFNQGRVYEFMADGIANGIKYLDDPEALIETFIGGMFAARNDRLLIRDVARTFGRTPSRLLPPSLQLSAIRPTATVSNWAKRAEAFVRRPYTRLPSFRPTGDASVDALIPELNDRVKSARSLYRASVKKDTRGRLTSGAKQAREDLRALREEAVAVRRTASAATRQIVSARAAKLEEIRRARELEAGFFGFNRAQWGKDGISSEGWIAVGKLDPRRFPGLAGHIFPQDVVVRMEKTVGDQGSNLARLANEVAGVFRTAGATTDANFPFLQGLVLLGRNPGRWVEAVTLAFSSLVSPSIRNKYLLVQMDRYPATMERFAAHVRALSEPELLRGARAGALPSRVASAVSEQLRRVPVLGEIALLPGRAVGQTFGRFAGSFDTFLDVARIEWWKAVEPLALARGQYALNELGAVVRNGTGTSSSAGLGVSRTQQQIEGAYILFAPRYTRSIFALLFDAMHGGLRGEEARRALSNLALAGAAMYYGVSTALGQEPDFNPSSQGFMAVRVGDNYVGIGSGYRSLLKAIATSVGDAQDDPSVFIDPSRWEENPALRFIRSRSSPTSSIAMDLVTGRDYIGRLTRSDPAALADYAGGRLLPFTLESYFEASGGNADRAKAITGEFLFGRSVPLSPSALRDEAVANVGYTTVDGTKIARYGDLSTAQRIDFDERDVTYTDQVKRQRLERASSFALLDEASGEKTYRLEQAATAYMQAGNDIYAGQRYRRSRASILTFYRGKYEGLREGAGITELEPKTVDQKILTGFFEEVVRPSLLPSGEPDWELQEELERSYRRGVLAQYGPSGLAALNRDLGASGDPIDEQFRASQDLLQPYWDHLDAAWTPAVLDAMGLSAAKSFPSYESFRNAFLQQMSTGLEGRAIPPALLGKYPSPTGQFNRAQSGQVALDIFNDLTDDFREFRTFWRNEFLKDNPDLIWHLLAWSYMTDVPEELEEYLGDLP